LVNPTLGAYGFIPENTPPIQLPGPAPRIKLPETTVNILLMGSDLAPDGEARTDTIIILSIDKVTGGVLMLSIPRDTYVYIPQNVQGNINTVMASTRYAPDGPIALLQQTILYNFGIPTQYYARIKIDGFVDLVDTLGGVDVPVACEFSDQIMISPTADPNKKESWKEFYQPVGVQHLDGEDAMWYSRLRKSTDDQDRSRRQQDVLKAIYYAAREQNMVTQLPALYEQYKELVETNMTLWDIVQFAPLVTSVEPDQVRTYTLRSPYINSWGGDEKFPTALLPDATLIYDYLKGIFTAVPGNQVKDAPFVVEVVNASGNADWGLLAAYTLRSYGLAAVLSEETTSPYETTTLVDYTPAPRGTPIDLLLKILNLKLDQRVALPDEPATVQYKLYLAADYDTCPLTNTTGVYPITRPTQTPLPSPTASETPQATPTKKP
jgi:LCP family protein required for cell wall assembly